MATTIASNVPPDRLPSKKEVDELICQEMNELTMDEREQVFRDVHGIQWNRSSSSAVQDTATANDKSGQRSTEID